MPGLREDREGASWLVKLVALFLVAAIVSAIYVTAFPNRSPPIPADEFVESGDGVEIDYTGYFTNGRVFDTSTWDVAVDNASYPKSPGFQFRGAQAQYRPLDFIVGGGSVIRGFGDGVLRMRVGEARVLTVPPDRGYGYGNAADRVARPIVEELPATEVLTLAGFQDKYLVPATAVHGGAVANPLWGWNATVFVSGELVTVQQVPEVGRTYRVYSRWDAIVESVDASTNGGVGAVRVRHILSADDSGALSSFEYGRKFFIRSVDPAGGTWLQDFNSETTGVDLIFHIRLVSLEKA